MSRRLTVSVSTFWDPVMNNKISIANSQPAACFYQQLRPLVPDWTMVENYKRDKDWELYSVLYESQITRRLSMMRDCGKISGADMPGMLESLLRAAAHSMHTDSITLCCWEKAEDPHCHRKLVYGWLPEKLRGQCR